MSRVKSLVKELKLLTNPEKKLILESFFKTGKGEYGEGDIFWGLTVPQVRTVVSSYTDDLDLDDINFLLKHEVHEVRLAGVFILVYKYEQVKDDKEKEKIVKFYIKHLECFNNWDLIDHSAYKILGDYLSAFEIKEALIILEKLARSKSLWRRRAAMVSTMSFIKKGRYKEVFYLADILKSDKHDLIQKALGWMLREVGKRIGEDRLKAYLNKNKKSLARVSLRYAIERMTREDRDFYLS